MDKQENEIVDGEKPSLLGWVFASRMAICSCALLISALAMVIRRGKCLMLTTYETQLASAKVEVEKPFPQEDELKTKSARLDELNILLIKYSCIAVPWASTKVSNLNSSGTIFTSAYILRLLYSADTVRANVRLALPIPVGAVPVGGIGFVPHIPIYDLIQ